jgi:hypothetical protein
MQNSKYYIREILIPFDISNAYNSRKVCLYFSRAWSFLFVCKKIYYGIISNEYK